MVDAFIWILQAGKSGTLIVTGDLERELAGLEPGDHVFCPYDDFAEALPTAAIFLRTALAQNYRCLYLTGERDQVLIEEGLATSNVDVSIERGRGALRLQLLPGHATSQALQPEKAVAYLRQSAVEAVQEGYAGLRVISEATWMLHAGFDSSQQVAFETLWNGLLEDSPQTALCQYDLHRFAAEALHEALRTHPLVLLRNRTYPNLFYEPPSLVSNPAALESRVNWMIDQVKRTSEVEEERYQLVQERGDWIVTGQKNRLFESILDSLDEGISVLDEHGRILFLNRAAREISGIGKVEDRGASPDYPAFELWKADGGRLDYPDWPINRILLGEVITDERVLLVRPDGQQRGLLCSGRALRGEELGAGLACLIFRDMPMPNQP